MNPQPLPRATGWQRLSPVSGQRSANSGHAVDQLFGSGGQPVPSTAPVGMLHEKSVPQQRRGLKPWYNLDCILGALMKFLWARLGSIKVLRRNP